MRRGAQIVPVFEAIFSAISSAILAASAAAILIAASSCKPDLGAPISLIQGPRILAVRGTPPEAKEGGSVTYDLLAVDASGTTVDPPASWAVCKEPRPPAETNAVSVACLTIPDQGGPAPIFAAPITAANPDDPTTTGACSIFGPLRPPLDPSARPRDPDVTGGFYEPVRATIPDPGGGLLRSFVLERIQCRLANAPIDIAGEFNNPYNAATNPNGYSPNQNPVLAQVTLAVAGGSPSVFPAIVAGMPAPAAPVVAAGAQLTFEASWDAEVAETFPVYDIRSVALIPQREALRVSWFATGGTFDHDVTGRAEDDQALTTSNGWVAPTSAGSVHLWLVLRDSRGGVAFSELALEVSP
jgi:hypothetical protein